MSFEPDRETLSGLFERLLDLHGAQSWWPAETTFEVMIGAVLTQNTAWVNVEKAIDGLRGAGLLKLDRMLAEEPASLAPLIRPAGYYNVKSVRLLNLCRGLDGVGGPAELARWPTDRLRGFLLGINGIGPETADDILLYGFERPVFVIDAYTRRLFSRLGIASGAEPYEEMRLGVETVLGPDASLFKEFHALIVMHGKTLCRVSPICSACTLRERCDHSP